MKQTRWGIDVSGASNIEELHSRIKRYFIRREKLEVLKELPPKTFITVPVELDKKTAKEYESASRSLANYLKSRPGKQPAAIAKAMAAEKLTQLNILRQLNAMGKLDIAKELIESVIESGEKVLVFSSFVEPLETLKEYFKDKAVIITGKTPVGERGGIVDTFQRDKRVQVFLGGYKSAGVGITLTAAENFIGLDYPWNPADLQQSIDRLHRPGQKANAVNIYQLVATNTIAEDMKETLDKKQGIFDAIIDGKINENITKEAMESAINRVLRNH
jgi:SWI/SNF-related matrix-associated actin-dependent regulator 1 of chromatin subfamily A